MVFTGCKDLYEVNGLVFDFFETVETPAAITPYRSFTAPFNDGPGKAREISFLGFYGGLG